MLECDFCGCYSPDGKGWVAYPGEEYAGIDEPGIQVFCPPCAVVVFGYQPDDAAAEYVCIFEPPPSPTEAI